MRATIYGETPKVDVHSRNVVNEFLKKEISRFCKLKNKSVIYTNKALIGTTGLNYLNVIPENKIDLALKNMILLNYNECENLYTYLGDLFLEYFFSKRVAHKGKISKFEKINQKKFLESIVDINVKCLIRWIFENTSLERTINVQAYTGKDMCLEVKHNIMTNNRRGSFKVLPVSLNANDENTLNILNDIAVIHDSSVVTSNMGQTISQEVRKNLASGKKITFLKDRIYIDPVANSEAITVHKKFLFKRLSDAITKPDVNIDPIKNRIKNFSMKKLNIYLPIDLSKNNTFQRELAYCISFLKNIDKQYKILTYDQREYYIPKELSNIVKNKVDSLNQTIKDIEIVIT